MVLYRVDIADAAAHRIRITLTVPRPAPLQAFTVPHSVPGSLAARDIARCISAFSASQGGCALAVHEPRHGCWQVQCAGTGPLVVCYDVDAVDDGVDGAFVDADGGFLDGSCIFVRAAGQDAAVHRLVLGERPDGWLVATSMAPSTVLPGAFDADGHEAFVDHPLLLGSRFWRGSFSVGGIDHALVVAGAWPTLDGRRLLADAAAVCGAHVVFWGGGALPFDRYVFLLRAADDNLGGLEHRASAALRLPRQDLPRLGEAARRDGSTRLATLLSHEYFHAWNGKRMRPRRQPAERASATAAGVSEPAALAPHGPPDPAALWFFEGFTTYCSELLLLRAGLLDAAGLLHLLARHDAAVRASPGRHLRSLAAASAAAAQPGAAAADRGAAAANASVSVYAKGALVALLCDLALRRRGAGTLDDVMRKLWRRAAGHGLCRAGAGGDSAVDAARAEGTDGGIAEADIAAALAEAGGQPLADDLQRWLHRTDELPLAPMLAAAGVAVVETPPTLAAQLGLVLSEGALSGVHVRQVLRGGAAAAAGLARGDELLAVAGWRIRRLDDARLWLGDAAAFDVLAVRDQRLLTVQVVLPDRPAAPAVDWLPDPHAAGAALALRRAWLGG